MMTINYELVKPLVEARQEQLRKEARTDVSRPGRLRTAIGQRLIRLGEQVGGRPRPAPMTPARLAVR